LLDRFALAGVIVLALWVRLYAIEQPGIWYDEAYSLLLAREGPARIWQLTALDVHPPLYYVLLHYWLMIWGEGALPARALSALADIGTLLLCIKLMSLIATRRATWMAALLLALLPISVRYSQEVRMYTLLGFWLMAATVALVCWSQAPERKRFVVAYVLLMSAAFYTHYFAGLCVLVHWLYWWKSRRADGEARLSLLEWVIANGLIVLFYIPWIPQLIDQMSHPHGALWIKPVSVQGALTLIWQFTVVDEVSAQSIVWQFIPLILMLFFVATVVTDKTLASSYKCLLAGYFFVPAITLYVMSLLVPLFVPRYLMFAAMGLPMVTAMALDFWGARQRLPTTLLLLLLLMTQIHGLKAVYQQTENVHRGDLRNAYKIELLTEEINKQIQEGDQIVVDSVMWYLPVAYYNKSGIKPTLFVADLTSEVSRFGYALIPDEMKWVYPHRLQFQGQRIWWLTAESVSVPRLLFPEEWEQLQVLKGGNISAHLFTRKMAPALSKAGHPSNHAAAISFGSKLSARAICHIRE
jgi:uncharacterized membrane protein